ncbi:MAG: hypothetical protein PHH41_02885 [Sulfurimonas sp.]|nr:hypothetical protein [Sulfurimonas sp.]
MLIKQLIVLLIFIILFALYTKKKIDLFGILIFLLPFNQIFINVGLNLYAYQFILILLIVLHLKKTKILFIGNKTIVLFISYVIISTAIISAFFITSFLPLGGFFRSEGRFIAQIILYLLTFSFIPISYLYISNFMDILKYFKIFFISLIVLSILGWIQFFIYNMTNIDIFPLAIIDGNIRSGVDVMLDMLIFRMSSLGGEPKGLAISLSIGVITMHTFNYYQIKFFKYDTLIKILFLSALLETLSTSGMVLSIILYIVFLVLTLKMNIKKMNIKKIIVSLMFLVGVLIIIIQNQLFFQTMIEHRILDRDIANEDFDAPIKTLLIDRPQWLLFGSGLGNIHNLAFQDIPQETAHYMSNTIFTAKSGYLKLVSELGLIGFGLFFLLNYSTYRRLKYRHNENTVIIQKQMKLLSVLLFIVFIAYMARVYAIGIYIFFFSAINALAYSKHGLMK